MNFNIEDQPINCSHRLALNSILFLWDIKNVSRVYSFDILKIQV